MARGERLTTPGPGRPEDLDTNAEDHVADQARYACLSRPLTAKPAVPAVNPSDRWERERGKAPRAMEGWKTL